MLSARHVEATGGAFNLPLAVDAEHVTNKPRGRATIVRNLSARPPVTALESKEGWPLVASGGKPLGYVATRDLAPLQCDEVERHSQGEHQQDETRGDA
jgi:hypothetical protein